MTIEPKIGVGSLHFGMNASQIEDLLGPPASVQIDSTTGFAMWDYGNNELAAIFLGEGKLTSVLVVPTSETLLWGNELFRMPAESIKRLLASNGHECKYVPSCHPAVRHQMEAYSAGLSFTLKDHRCDDVEVMTNDTSAAVQRIPS